MAVVCDRSSSTEALSLNFTLFTRACRTTYTVTYLYTSLEPRMANRRLQREKKDSFPSSKGVANTIVSFLKRPSPPSPKATQENSWQGLDSQSDAFPPPSWESQNPDLMGQFKALLQHELAKTAADITNKITGQIHELGQRIDVMETKMDDVVTVLEAHEQDIVQLQKQLKEAHDKLEDTDNRSRRNNLRIRGIPESETDLQAVTHTILSTLLPDLPSECDRAHRALRPKSQEGPPRDIILRLHFHQTQVKALQAAGASQNLEYNAVKFQIYTDVAPVTLQKCKSFAGVIHVLQHQGIRYRWLFPFPRAFLLNNKQYSFSDLESAMELLRRLELTTTLPPSSPPSSPIWRMVGKPVTRRATASALSQK
ncbi:uncharacterized protein LOC734625 [Xenopus laevis]|uniref:MGC98825 protein n=1 Tax=Xenopus laevis TaxID=8355 RepID=Q4QQP7_XENLA|nr:uncharacterized protein LOC734625 [Xenopus laevis]AAH98176.1 MGC98825 protein [Xenopus laevis]